MAQAHDRAARKIAKGCGGSYDPTRSPDVQCATRRVEVKSRASEIPKALQQLRWSRQPKYVALPASEHGRALPRLQGTGVGLMNFNGQIAKKARRHP